MLLFLAALLTFEPVDAGLPTDGMWRHGFAIADMNGDGAPDLVFTSPRKRPGPPIIFLNDGNSHFTRWDEASFPAIAFDYGAVSAADFNGDGAMDLAVGSHYRGVVVLLGSNRGLFTAVNGGFTFPSTFSSRALTVTDWNGDGRPDVAALSDGPRPLASVQLGVTVFENLDWGWKPTRAATADSIFGDSIAAGDVDGDGLGDLVTASHDLTDQGVLRLGADGALVRRQVQTMLPAAFARAVDAADFDGDGRDEIVIGYIAATQQGSLLEIVSFPPGWRENRLLWSEDGAAIAAVATGDLNGDGRIDVVAALTDGRLLTFRGDGKGGVIRDRDIDPSPWRRGCDAYAVDLADLDGDGRAEIVATFAGESGCTSEGGIEVWRNAPAHSIKRRAVRR